MNIYKAIHALFGEYIFETDSAAFPRFANLLSEKKLNFWGSAYKEGKVTFSSSVFTSEEVADTASEAHVPLKIIARKGLPFFFSRYRKRYGLMLGFAFGVFLLFYSQLFIWKIEIKGNQSLSPLQVEQALAECGVEVGSFIPKIDVGYTKNILLLNCRDLSSAAISINGTHVTVSVLERTYLPDILDRTGYYNVVAAEDGIIMDIDAVDGTPEVREGDVVFKGQLLINSFCKRNNDTYRPTHAQGIVYAAVKREFKTKVPLNRISKSYTGKTDSKTRLEILGWELPELFGAESEYEYFDSISARKNVKLFGFIELPVVKYNITYVEYEPISRTITPEMAEEYANEELKDYLTEMNAEVLECESDFSHDEENGICVFVANAVVKLNIAKEVEFDLNQSISERLDKASE